MEYKDNDKFRLIDGLVYKKGDDRARFLIPDTINSIIKIYHDDMAHCGIEKMYKGILASYWFPSMRKKIKDYISNCITCLIANSSSYAREEEMQISTISTKPFELVYLDRYGLLPQAADGAKHILVVIDAFTRFTVWFFRTRSTTARETCDYMRFLFNVFGTPKEIVTDRSIRERVFRSSRAV